MPRPTATPSASRPSPTRDASAIRARSGKRGTGSEHNTGSYQNNGRTPSPPVPASITDAIAAAAPAARATQEIK